MNNLDGLSVDGRLLAMFLAVSDSGSVTAAALSLNVTQSTVSHGIKRLRAITGDELFVPMGRGITPTDKAQELAEEARVILRHMQQFSRKESYDPAQDTQPFTIAATDYEIEVIVKPFMDRLRTEAPLVQLRVMRAYSDREWAGLLRAGDVDLVLAPELQTAETDIKQRRILKNDADVIYFDADQRSAPDTLDAYCTADHVIMSPGAFSKTNVDHILTEMGQTRRIAASLPSFASVAAVLKGTDLIALMPSRLSTTLFAEFAQCSPPIETAHDTIASIWHIRSDASPRHKWMRQLVAKDA